MAPSEEPLGSVLPMVSRLLLSGAIAGGVAGIARNAPDLAIAHSGHGTKFLPGTSDGGKMYDDIAAGQCSAGNWTCYMTMTASIMPSVPSQYNDEISSALTQWNETDTTLWYNLVADNSANDLRVKMTDLEATYGAGAVGHAFEFNFHSVSCGESADCEDTNENPPPASHQPERWWYTYVALDDDEFPAVANKVGFVTHEIGHTLGLAHQTMSGCPNNSQGVPYSIMDNDCLLSPGAVEPKKVDMCGINHASDPLMYGNDPNRAWHQC